MSHRDDADFSDRLREFMGRHIGRGKTYPTIKKFCEAIGIKQTQLGTYTDSDPARRRRPGFDTLFRLKMAGMDIDWGLVGDEEGAAARLTQENRALLIKLGALQTNLVDARRFIALISTESSALLQSLDTVLEKESTE